MATKVEIKLVGMYDSTIDRSSSRNVPSLAGFIFGIGAEEARMVPLLDNDQRNAWSVVARQVHARFLDSTELVHVHVFELTLAHAISVK